MVAVTHAVLLSATAARRGTWFSPQAAERPDATPLETTAPVHSVLQSLGKAARNCLAQYHHHQPDPTPGECSPCRLSRRRSPWSAWKCTTCCGGQCPGGRPGRRPPGWQCTPLTRWSFSQRLCGPAPPLPPRREGRPAAAAALRGLSPPSGTSAGCRAGGGSQCLPAAAPAPWREARAACSTHCWGVWWRRECAPRCGGSRWRRSPQGHRAAVTRSIPEAAWWSHGTRGSAGPSGWSSSAAGTRSSRCACSPAAWAAGGGCSSWSKSGTPAESPGIRSPWWMVQGSAAGLVMSLAPTPRKQGVAAFPPLLLRAAPAFPTLLFFRATPGSSYRKHRKTSSLKLSAPETNRKRWNNRLLTKAVGTEESSQGRMKTSTDLVI